MLRSHQFLLLVGSVFGFVAPLAAAPPNVLLILTDDMGYGDVRSHGNPQIDTPVLDRLAAAGARFERFFVSPVCSPTRASLLTGRYHLRTGVWDVTSGGETLPADEVTIAEVFRAAGYATGCFGKWHNGAHYPQHPRGQGFDEFYGFCGGHWNDYFDYELERDGQLEPFQGYITDVLTDHALRFIAEHRQQPWLCYLPYNAPHSPFQVPDALWQKYQSRGFSDEHVACVYAMVESIDANIGRLLAKLDELNLADNTIVVFLTDNGANTERYNAGMLGRKGSLHEGGSRVPLFVRWPGHIPTGTVVKPIAAHIDLLPTLMELAGVSTIASVPCDGRSLAPLLAGKTEGWPERKLFTHWGVDRASRGPIPNRGAVRTDRYRAVQEKGTWSLYDMQADPGQKQNLAASEPQMLRELAASFDAWLAEVTRNRPTPARTEIGHEGWPVVVLPAHEAMLRPGVGQGIAFAGSPAGFANDYLTAWTDPRASARWDLRVVSAGSYRAEVLYVAGAECVGARLQVSVGDQVVVGTVTKAQDPQPLPTHDRLPRKNEAFPKVWGTVELGDLKLREGDQTLALEQPAGFHKPGVEVKAVRLTKRAPPAAGG